MSNPIVTITMENGDVMKAELYPEIAPNTVNNFISLVKKGFYDGLIFHRVIAGFMIQGGDPDSKNAPKGFFPFQIGGRTDTGQRRCSHVCKNQQYILPFSGKVICKLYGNDSLAG